MSALNVAVIEELAKLIPVIAAILVLRHQRRTLTPLDGLIFGAAAGTGFAVLETLGYAFVTVVHAQGHLTTQVDDLLLARGLLAPATHLAWTSLNAAALTALLNRRTAPRALVATGCLAATITAHTAWDTTNNDAVHLALTLTGVTALAYSLTRLNSVPPPLDDYRSGHDPSGDLSHDERDTGRRSSVPAANSGSGGIVRLAEREPASRPRPVRLAVSSGWSPTPSTVHAVSHQLQHPIPAPLARLTSRPPL